MVDWERKEQVGSIPSRRPSSSNGRVLELPRVRLASQTPTFTERVSTDRPVSRPKASPLDRKKRP